MSTIAVVMVAAICGVNVEAYVKLGDNCCMLGDNWLPKRYAIWGDQCNEEVGKAECDKSSTCLGFDLGATGCNMYITRETPEYTTTHGNVYDAYNVQTLTNGQGQDNRYAQYGELELGKNACGQNQCWLKSAKCQKVETDLDEGEIHAGVNAASSEGALEGCMDREAVNFLETATVEDGSCQFLGCMDPHAMNYVEKATIADQSSCVYPIHGCMDNSAYNFQENANMDDGSCIFACDSNTPCAKNTQYCQTTGTGAALSGTCVEVYSVASNWNYNTFSNWQASTGSGADYGATTLSPPLITWGHSEARSQRCARDQPSFDCESGAWSFKNLDSDDLSTAFTFCDWTMNWQPGVAAASAVPVAPDDAAASQEGECQQCEFNGVWWTHGEFAQCVKNGSKCQLKSCTGREPPEDVEGTCACGDHLCDLQYCYYATSEDEDDACWKID